MRRINTRVLSQPCPKCGSPVGYAVAESNRRIAVEPESVMVLDVAGGGKIVTGHRIHATICRRKKSEAGVASGAGDEAAQCEGGTRKRNASEVVGRVPR